ncbi:MAG: hypothetical protein QE284_04215 [Rhizobium sp.]|nr:hypothetical protein [Rhizobium sp.]
MEYHARRLMPELRRPADEAGRTIVIVLHDKNTRSALPTGSSR